MDTAERKTSLTFQTPQALGLAPQKDYLLFNVQERFARTIKGEAINPALSDIAIPGQSLQLFYLRTAPTNAPVHLWGGKRLSEVWDAEGRQA